MRSGRCGTGLNGLFELYMAGCFRNEGVIAGWWLAVTAVLQALRDLQHGSQRGNRNSDRGKQIDRRENIDSDKIVDHGGLLSGGRGGQRAWRARSRIGLPPVEPSHVLGDDGWSGLAVGGGAVGLGRCVVALDGEGARLAAVRVSGRGAGGRRVHRAVSIFLMALRAVGSEEMPRTRRAS